MYRFASTVAFHPDGNCIGVGTSDNVVKVHKICNYGFAKVFPLSIDLGHSSQQAASALLW